MDQPPVTPPVTETGQPGPASDTSKLLAALGYVIPIVALVAILIEPYKDEKFVRLHAIQSLALAVAGIVISIINVIPIIGQLIWLLGGLVILVLAIMGLINAAQGKYWEMPVVYGVIKGYV